MIKHLTILTALAAGTTLAPAAVISWGTATAVDASATGGLQVSTAGTFVEAFNAGGGTTGTTTVNGVVFTNTDTDLLNNQWNGPGSPVIDDAWEAGGADAHYDALLSTAEYGGGGGFFTIDLGGGKLSDGQKYELQVWFVEDRSGLDGRVMHFSDASAANFADVNDQFVIGTFTADGTSQTLGLDAQGFGNAHISAYQLRAVPEASSAALIGLGGLSLILRRKR
ncbi:PEP-CTERM sorting domain-containing protein [Oceaniferula marina]|nr:PEP-CTERM sorting domain-containing protein [Oceaniferula marina]